ncbi:MAG: hypothetical protein Kow0063_19450 [Anaerolineae bacterium]
MTKLKPITSIAGLLLLLILTTGCTLRSLIPASPTPVDTATPEVTATSELEASPLPAAATGESLLDEPVTPEPELPIRLTLWTVAAVSTQAGGEAGDLFNRGIEAFEKTYPDIRVSVVLKNESGKGSVADYLRTASKVAPSVLPDVVVLNVADLAPLARSGLIVPLDELLSSALMDDLLPGARAAGSVDEQLMGVPFEMEVEHLIYNTNKVPSTPLVWTDVISANTTYLFPAKGRNGLVNDAFLIQYLALGGRLQDDEGGPFLDEQALQAALEYYHQGVEAGVILPEVLNIGNPDEIWPAYVAAQVGMAHTRSQRFLSDKDVLRSTQFAAIPTRDGKPLTIGRGRALAVVTRSPERQAAARLLIEWFVAPDNNVAWSQATSYIPTRYAAFNLIGGDDPYWPFLQSQLEVAVPSPAFPEYDQIGRVLQQAVIEVLSGETTPEEAAAAAVDAITP